MGRHNLENILSAAGVGSALTLPPEAIQTGIDRTLSIPGRLERVPGSPDRPVYVDYAHTPDALENVLKALEQLAPERIICIFGCGGNRDRSKRPLMGQIAATFAHLSIVTSDNPRSENPGDIIDQIIAGVRRFCQKEYAVKELEHGFRHKGYCRNLTGGVPFRQVSRRQNRVIWFSLQAKAMKPIRLLVILPSPSTTGPWHNPCCLHYRRRSITSRDYQTANSLDRNRHHGCHRWHPL